MHNLEEMLPNENCVILGYSASVKFLDEEGGVSLMHVSDGQLARWEIIGMLTSHLDDVRDQLRQENE